MSKAKKTTRDIQREETFERVFNTAIEEFCRVGVDKARIDFICETAGVAKGTFFFHFATKDHVLLERQRRISEAMALRMEAELISVRSVKGFLTRLANIVLEEHEAVGDPELVRKISAAIVRMGGSADLGVSATSFGRTLTSQVERLQKGGYLRTDIEAAQLADCLRLSLFGFLVNPQPSFSHVRPTVGLLVDLLSTALERQP
jgi:TetR/AcrR family transcriptional repressor of uid operon